MEDLERPIHETIDEFGDDVVSHQKRGNFHRLVLCNRPPPQTVTDWMPYDEPCSLGRFYATWNKVEVIPF